MWGYGFRHWILDTSLRTSYSSISSTWYMRTSGITATRNTITLEIFSYILPPMKKKVSCWNWKEKAVASLKVICWHRNGAGTTSLWTLWWTAVWWNALTLPSMTIQECWIFQNWPKNAGMRNVYRCSVPLSPMLPENWLSMRNRTRLVWVIRFILAR